QLNGVFKIYNKDGFLINALQYENGELIEKTDDFTTDIDVREKFDKNENLIFQGTYFNQKPIGVHRYFDKKGNVIQSKTYDAYHQLISEGIVQLDGKKQGTWIDYYPDGNIKAKGYYQNGIKSGKWIFYFPNGNIEQTGTYTNGKLSGRWKWYFKNGQLRKEEFYIYGLPDGESVEYSDSGTVIAKGNYIQGEKEGTWNYDIGDQTETGKYVMGLKDGKWFRYYKSNHELANEGIFLQGSLDGKQVYYHPNGNIKEIQYFETGKKIRYWAKYDEKGELFLVVQYKQNKIYKINGVKIDFTNNNDQ
ncbi:MAG: toxin-antitoxin system YwqK family antitoxin, partial [Bacteroidota bacterium]